MPYYPPAGGGGSSNSAGLAGKDAVYVLSTFNAEYTNAVYISPGSSVTTHITGSNLFINATTNAGTSVTQKPFEYYKMISSSNLGGQFDRLYCAARANATALANQTIVVNTMNFMPVAVMNSFMIDSIEVFCDTTAAGCLLRLGIYSNSSDTVLYPFQSIATSGIRAGSTNAKSVFNTVQTLSSNSLYWLCLFVGTANLTDRGLPVASTLSIFGADSGFTTAPGVGVLVGGLFGSGLPASVATGGNIMTSAIPAIAVSITA